jgi:hypothetical protein
MTATDEDRRLATEIADKNYNGRGGWRVGKIGALRGNVISDIAEGIALGRKLGLATAVELVERELSASSPNGDPLVSARPHAHG